MSGEPPKDPSASEPASDGAAATPARSSARADEPADRTTEASGRADEPAAAAPAPWLPQAPPPAAELPPLPPHRPWVTIVLATANIGVWLVSVALGASPFDPSPQWLADHGGNLGAITLAGEEWRLFTSMFLHIGLLHLAMNMVGLIVGGRLVERLFGHLGFAAIYLISGLAGSLATALRPGVVSAGASGAIFGVLGALGAYYVVHRERMDQRIAKEATGLFIVVAYNVVIGFTQSGIDMYAHLGGLAAGFLCGFAMEVAGGGTLPRKIAVAALGLGALIAGTFVAPTPHDEGRAAILAFGSVEEKVIARWGELVDQVQREAITDDELAGAIEQDILLPWREARDAFERTGAGGPQRATLLDYMRVRQEGWETIAEGLRARDGEQVKRGQERLQQADGIAGKLTQ